MIVLEMMLIGGGLLTALLASGLFRFVLLVVWIGFVFVISNDMTGRPRILNLAPTGEHEILGGRVAEGKAIYVLLDMPKEPRYYRVPYSRDLAESLQNGLQGSEGRPLMFRYEPSLETRPIKIYPRPHEALPPKTG